MQKNARELKIGDVIVLSGTSTFTIKKMYPSPLTGWGAPIIEGVYNSGKQGKIDLGTSPRLTDHLFEVQ